ncbi:MAG: hypothetical protein ABJQ29_02570 [Luteolibacter sp.]
MNINPLRVTMFSETMLGTRALAHIGGNERESGSASARFWVNRELGSPVGCLLDEISQDVPAGIETFFATLAELVLAGLGIARELPYSQMQILFPSMDETELESMILRVLMDVRVSVWYFDAIERYQAKFVSAIESLLLEQVASFGSNERFSFGADRNRPLTKFSMMPVSYCV